MNTVYHYNSNYFHIFKKRNKYFLFFINNLSILEINKHIYQVLKIPSPITAKKVKEKYSLYSNKKIKVILNELLEWEILTPPNLPEGEEKLSSSQSNILHDFSLTINGVPVFTRFKEIAANGLFLVISQDCNLRCKYCSAEYGKFGMWKSIPSGNPKVKLMSKDIAKKSIDFYFSQRDKINYNNKNEISSKAIFISNDNTKTNPSIYFDGGEPLLNFEIIKFCVNYARSINENTNFSMITNGTLMNKEKAQWLIENNVKVTFSIDGTKKIHNKSRIYKNGRGSYDNATRGFKIYQKYSNKPPYTLFSKGGVNFEAKTSIPKGVNLIECVHNLWELGFANVITNYAWESSFIDNENYRMKKKDFANYFKEFNSLCEEITENIIAMNLHWNNKGIHLINLYLNCLKNKRMINRGCDIGKSVSITTDGSIFICNGLTGYEIYKIGDIFNGINYNFEPIKRIYENYWSKCDKCWARNICGSGCIAKSIKYNELDNKFPASRTCDFNKKAIESVIYMYSRIKEERPEILTKT